MTWTEPLVTSRVRALIDGEWVDFTGRVRQYAQPLTAGSGQQTNLAGPVVGGSYHPSTFSLALDNRDAALTPGRSASPYAPHWGTGTRMQWTETIGAKTFVIADGFVEIPEVELTFEDVDDTDRTDRIIRVNCIDWLTRLNRAPRFISNHGAWITHNVADELGTGLEAYYPLGELDGLRFRSSGQRRREPLIPAARADLITASASRVVHTDDLSGVHLDYGAVLAAEFGSNVLASTSEAITLSAWVSFDAAQAGQLFSLGSISTFTVTIAASSVEVVASQFGTATFTGIVVPTGWPCLFSVRADATTGEIGLWINGVQIGSYAGSAPATFNTFDGLSIGPIAAGIGHAQLVVATPDAYPTTALATQYAAGRDGLSGQSVDQRIRTICTYAGVPDGLLELQECDSLMAEARFADQRPGALVAQAVATGGGVMFSHAGEIIYQDRKHRFGL